MMLFPLLAVLLQISSVWAAPMEPSVLAIPVRDIIEGDLSAHEAHPNFELYTRWLETTQGSYIRRDPKAAFTKYSRIASVDCRSHDATCFFTSRVPFTDITESKRDLDLLNSALAEQLQARDSEVTESPAALALRALQKRSGFAATLYASLHYKTYHNLGPDNPVAGFQHYIVWDLKCQTVQFTSSGFQLTGHTVRVDTENSVSADLSGTLIGDDPNSGNQHSVFIGIGFVCSLFGNKCCLAGKTVQNYVGGIETWVPKTEPIECVAARDVSNQNCESYIGGWCGVHIRQYQKNEGPGLRPENYRFDVILYDGEQELVGESELLSIPSGETMQVGSTLPYTLGVTAPQNDPDAVYMSYNGQSWGSNDQDHHCDFGGFDSGHRDGDCGFSC
ncbi:hypothetical protein BGW36DRAFT_408118 [Talaromyces proteolyticus]|uniref:Uncharacterized protein n=1 Tax=Talaromyces proteolyticus TaxID=1131652 RepID=A0AAD4KPH2_9EURO|nr:uncharacterized protein BGW36DRAFT_408118 [Talaromyces proteolyticus]KAH8696168.1 hypothetical protein BGW36DRAFT_408118 [Talaromyces proteolyticus]